MMCTLYEFCNVGKRFSGTEEDLDIFSSLNLQISAGDSLAIVGASGSGKSTLLHLMGALDTPSEGKLLFDGADMGEMSADAQAHFRNREVGFVFQFHHLLPEFSAAENVAMQAMIAGVARRVAVERAKDVLTQVGLGHRLEHKVTTLSGGERQRAAIARAIVNTPRVLLADEPTGNLDETTGAQVGELLARLNEDLGMTLVVVTHNSELATQMGRRFELRAGGLYDKTNS